MWEKFWDLATDAMTIAFMPLVCFYHTLTSDFFLNVAIRDATAMEQAANTLLSPVHYLLAGKEAALKPDGTWKFVQRFDYTELFWIKTAASITAFVPSLVLGSAVKAASLLDPAAKTKFASLKNRSSQSNRLLYESLGMKVSETAELATSLGCARRPGDENNLAIEKEALKEITTLLNEKKISWWVDCGTCLGAYRYGGVIPWDWDLDIAILLPDFDNVVEALQKLDPKKYAVQDWSGRDFPKTYLKVFIAETGRMIDIYGFEILPETKEVRYLFSLDQHIFFPEWFKIRERRLTSPVAYNTLFPLKKMEFDGLEIFIPNDAKSYLQRYYGEDLAPAKVYDPETCAYEKDLTHPYWQREYAH